jgi:hypothetical protein
MAKRKKKCKPAKRARKTKTAVRDARSGRFVDKGQAVRRPDTTVTETIDTPKHWRA